MSKELTEKWKNGEIDDGLYYFKLPSEKIVITSKWGIIESVWKDRNDEIECLAPVPSYEEYQALLSDQLAKNEGVEINAELEAENKKLKEQFDIAVKALEKIERIKVGKENNFSITIAHSYSMEALKEMKGVK